MKAYETLELEVISVNTDVVLTASNVAESAYVNYDSSFDFWSFLDDEGN